MVRVGTDKIFVCRLLKRRRFRMSVKLRDLIRNVRSCKTAAEERAIVAKECALIRTAFKVVKANCVCLMRRRTLVIVVVVRHGM